MHYVPVLLHAGSETGQKVVDLGILKTLKALETREGHVVLVEATTGSSRRGRPLLDGRRRVAILGFRETTSIEYVALEAQGLETLDLETDAQAFTWRLPRIRVIPIDQFDPAQFLVRGRALGATRAPSRVDEFLAGAAGCEALDEWVSDVTRLLPEQIDKRVNKALADRARGARRLTQISRGMMEGQGYVFEGGQLRPHQAPEAADESEEPHE